jgi:hypothetical protein
MTSVHTKPNDLFEFVSLNLYRVRATTSLFGDNSEREPPDPIPNSEVKLLSADDSVGVPM